MSYSQANLKPLGLRKRKSTITVTDDELQRQNHSKMTAGDGPESIDSTATAEPTDGINLVDPTIIEPDEESDKILTVDSLNIVDMFAKLKVERERAAEKAMREGRRVMKEIVISERCTSCEKRIFHMGRCNDCRKCTTCGQQMPQDGKCQECAKLRCAEWRDNVDQSPISQGTPTCLDSHPSKPDSINSTPVRGKAEVGKLDCAASSLPTMPAAEKSENDKDAVVLWKLVASSLSTMQPVKLKLDGKSEADILIIAIHYLSKQQPDHGSERVLPGIDYIRCQNHETELRFNAVPLQQMERLLSGIPDAQVVAFFILSQLPEEHHALLSSTKMIAEERDLFWRGHVLVGNWSEEEREAFAFEFTRLVRGTRSIKSVLQKWRGLLEVLFPIIISILSFCS